MTVRDAHGFLAILNTILVKNTRLVANDTRILM